MEHPYRSETLPAAPARPAVGDERFVGGLVALIGAVPVIVALAGRAAFGAEETIGLMLLVLGLVELRRAR